MENLESKKRKKSTLTLEQKVININKLNRGVQDNRLALKENIPSAIVNTLQDAK